MCGQVWWCVWSYRILQYADINPATHSHPFSRSLPALAFGEEEEDDDDDE